MSNVARIGISVALAIAACAIGVALPGHAAIQPHSAVLGGITFPTGTNGCTGPLVGVYGDSGMQTFILQAARDYCNYQQSMLGIPGSSAADVEYAAGGSSCPGDQFAANNGDANELVHNQETVFVVNIRYRAVVRRSSTITPTSTAKYPV